MLLAMVMFCLSLEHSFSKIPCEINGAISRVGYQDDTYLVGNFHTISVNWPVYLRAFASCGHIVNTNKSEGYLPCMDRVSTHALPSALRTLFQSIARSTGGFKCLGSAAQGQLESRLGPYQFSLGPMHKRLEKARHFCDRLVDFIRRSPDESSLHIAWLHVSRSISRALSYDARLIDPSVFRCVSAPLDDRIVEVIGVIVGKELSPRARDVVSLPGPLGGCSCRLPGSDGLAAFVASFVRTSSCIPSLSVALTRPIVGRTNQLAFDQAKATLLELGVAVSAGGITFTSPALEDYVSGPWCKDTSASSVMSCYGNSSANSGPGFKLHGAIMRGLESIAATRVWRQGSEFERTVLLSSGGAGAGKVLSVIPSDPSLLFPNQHFRTILLMKLCMVDVPQGAVCQVPRAKLDGDAAFCGCPLDGPLIHPHRCKAGPARLRPHRGLATVLAQQAKQAGAHVDMERACPHLYLDQGEGRILEAIMDVVFHFPGGPSVRHIDVTVRSPHAERYAHADVIPGVAAKAGVSDKLDRYGPSVLAVSLETYGRMDPCSVSHVREMSFDFTRPCSRQSPGLAYQRLRYRLEHALLFEIADIVIQSLGGTAFFNWRGRRR